MSARHDYPKMAWHGELSDGTGRAPTGSLEKECATALNEIDSLRRGLRDAENELAYIYNRTTGPEYARQLEDAALALWAEVPPERVYFLDRQSPALVEFLRHLHDSIEHEQAMVRVNVWAES